MPKTNQYSALFFRLTEVEKKGFQTACKETLLKYLNSLPRRSNRLNPPSSIRIEIEELIKHIESAQIGDVLLNYKFKSSISDEMSVFIQRAKLKETSLFNMPSELVIDCENKAAGQGNSPQSIYEQCARLEKALRLNTVPSHHLDEVSAKIIVWYQMLYEKFAFLILEAKDINVLERNIQNSFPEDILIEIPDSLIYKFWHEMECQVEFLENQQFFEKFYVLSNLAEKYKFAYDFYQNLKETGRVTAELRATLIALFYLIINKAYAPCDVKKFNLMRDEGATIEDVFTALKAWTAMHWKKYAETSLAERLQEKLSEQEQSYQAWEEVCFREGFAQGPNQKPMFELHCVKYAADPTQDPSQLLKMLPSPQKPKNNRAIGSSTQATQIPQIPPSVNSVSLLSDEVLDWSDEKENKDQRKIGAN